MAGAFVTVKIDDRELQELLGRIMQHITDMTPVFREIGEVVQESVQRNFEEHRAPDGTPWKPLAESTRQAKAKKGRSSDNILIMNRILMGSIHPEAHSDRVEIGTDIIYGAIHQFGGLTGRGHSVEIPARTFLGVREEDWPEISNTVLDFLVSRK